MSLSKLTYHGEQNKVLVSRDVLIMRTQQGDMVLHQKLKSTDGTRDYFSSYCGSHIWWTLPLYQYALMLIICSVVDL